MSKKNSRLNSDLRNFKRTNAKKDNSACMKNWVKGSDTTQVVLDEGRDLTNRNVRNWKHFAMYFSYSGRIDSLLNCWLSTVPRREVTAHVKTLTLCKFLIEVAIHHIHWVTVFSVLLHDTRLYYKKWSWVEQKMRVAHKHRPWRTHTHTHTHTQDERSSMQYTWISDITLRIRFYYMFQVFLRVGSCAGCGKRGKKRGTWWTWSDLGVN